MSNEAVNNSLNLDISIAITHRICCVSRRLGSVIAVPHPAYLFLFHMQSGVHCAHRYINCYLVAAAYLFRDVWTALSCTLNLE